MVLDVLRQALAAVDALLQLRVRDVARDDQRPLSARRVLIGYCDSCARISLIGPEVDAHDVVGQLEVSTSGR